MRDKITSILDMLGTYPQRKVANYSKDNIVIDTSKITDYNKNYETGIVHPKFHDGFWVIVETYDTKKEARIGHDKWVKIMTSKDLPKELYDVNESIIRKRND